MRLGIICMDKKFILHSRLNFVTYIFECMICSISKYHSKNPVNACVNLVKTYIVFKTFNIPKSFIYEMGASFRTNTDKSINLDTTV